MEIKEGVMLKDIKGLMVDKIPLRDEKLHTDYLQGTISGHNKAVDSQASRTITLDREKTAKRIWDTYYSKGAHPGGCKLIWEDKKNNDSKFWAYEQADAEIAHLPELLIKGKNI